MSGVDSSVSEGSAKWGLNRRQRHVVIVAVALSLLVLLVDWIYQRMTHVYTDDARIAADMITISSKVSGWVAEFPISSGDRLSAGDTVAVIDFRDTELALRELQSQLEAKNAAYQRAEAEIAMVAKQTEGGLQVAKSALGEAQASLAAASPDLEFSQSEWQRAQSLKAKSIISEKDWESARAGYQRAKQVEQRARAGVDSAEARLLEAQANQTRLNVLQKGLAKLGFERDALQLAVERRRIELQDRTMIAPSAGIVDKTFVNPGEYVSPGQRLLVIHNPSDVWVDANIKETEVRHLKAGQKVLITVDAYPDERFEGLLDRIGDAATSQFALLPSTNPSGNFTKITQRIPIKITVPEHQGMLKPGMMVEVEIDVR